MNSESNLEIIKGLVVGNYTSFYFIMLLLGVLAMFFAIIFISKGYRFFESFLIVMGTFFFLLSVTFFAIAYITRTESRSVADSITIKEVVNDYPLEFFNPKDIDFDSLLFIDEEKNAHRVAISDQTKIFSDGEKVFIKVKTISFDLPTEQFEDLMVVEVKGLESYLIEQMVVLELHY